MKKNRGFGLLEVLIVVVIIGMAAAIVIQFGVKIHRGGLGKYIAKPSVGQIYLVRAVDVSSSYTVIAMPWQYGGDKPGNTDRRVLLTVQENVCKVDTWFIRGLDGCDHIIPTPGTVALETNPLP